MIESIKIKVGDKTIELTLEEAVQLKNELQNLFDQGDVVSIPSSWKLEEGNVTTDLNTWTGTLHKSNKGN